LRKLTPSRVALEIALDSQTVDQAFKEVYRELARGAKIPGFRKGKAPREVVERTFGQEDIRQRVWRKLAGRAFMDAVEEVGVIPIDLPNFDYTEPQENQPLTVQATVTIKPEPKLGEYKGIKLRPMPSRSAMRYGRAIWSSRIYQLFPKAARSRSSKRTSRC